MTGCSKQLPPTRGHRATAICAFCYSLSNIHSSSRIDMEFVKAYGVTEESALFGPVRSGVAYGHTYLKLQFSSLRPTSASAPFNCHQ